ncbi:hypothetical protein [Spirosoma flavum]|uniref:Leishmanolysin-like peptidase n=1 Tax=Spirosoma flavum TaxID=2048557 RepID=A0ABW6AIQ9_9BACT
MTGYSNYEKFARLAVVKLEEVLNSDEFRKAVLSGNYIRTNGFSNKDLYEQIMKAHEVQGEGGEDKVIDLRLRTLSLDSDGSGWMKACDLNSRYGTIGIDGNRDGIAAICPQRLELWAKENSISELAGHYAHEYMHIIGFSHHKCLSSQNWREKTFVYKIGNLVTELISNNGNAN